MKAPSAIRVMVVEDHGLLAQSLRLALTAEGMTVCVPALDPAEILAMAEQEKPDVVLLDLDLGPLGGDGSILIEPLALSGARVIVVSGVTDRVRLAGCLESGAHALLSKDAPLDRLLDAVRRTAAGDAVLAAGERDALLAELRRTRAARGKELAPFEALTPRERAVLSAFSTARPCDKKANRPPGDAALAEAARLLGPAGHEPTVDLEVYARIAGGGR